MALSRRVYFFSLTLVWIWLFTAMSMLFIGFRSVTLWFILIQLNSGRSFYCWEVYLWNNNRTWITFFKGYTMYLFGLIWFMWYLPDYCIFSNDTHKRHILFGLISFSNTFFLFPADQGRSLLLNTAQLTEKH